MITVSNLHKHYRVHGATHKVLQNINLNVPAGHRLALIGRNGSGKSTLIRLIGKVEYPTIGTVEHGMNVSWPLGFSGAFQGSLSGIDNIKFISRIYEIEYSELRDFVDDFSELGKHLNKPVKMYSSGMRARLAFALSIAIDFDCFLIDEVILVGDQRFHQRCMDYLFNSNNPRAMVIASHDMGLLTSQCHSALVLENSTATEYNSVPEAVEEYSRSMKM